MKVLLAKTACDMLEVSGGAEEACGASIKVLENKVSGRGGVNLVSSNGEIGFAFNTPRMAFAFKEKSNKDIIVCI